jgi:hypothetical protein
MKNINKNYTKILLTFTVLMLTIVNISSFAKSEISPSISLTYTGPSTIAKNNESYVDIKLTNDLSYINFKKVSFNFQTPSNTDITYIGGFPDCEWVKNLGDCGIVSDFSEANVKLKYWVTDLYTPTEDIKVCYTVIDDLEFLPENCFNIPVPPIANNSTLPNLDLKETAKSNVSLNAENYIDYEITNLSSTNHITNFTFDTMVPEKTFITWIDSDGRLTCNFNSNKGNCKLNESNNFINDTSFKIRVKYWASSDNQPELKPIQSNVTTTVLEEDKNNNTVFSYLNF